jgi:multiple sugar transport system substrate-binding protein
MKATLVAALLGLILLSWAAWRTQPPAPPPGVTPIVWVSDANPVRQEQMDLFNKTHRNLRLELDSNTSGSEKVIVQAIGGVGPDVFDCYTSVDFDAYRRAGIAWDVTDELAARGIDVKTDVWPVAFPSLLDENGRVYGVPCNVGHTGIWFNKDMFDEARVSYPKGSWTTKEFLSVAQRLTKRNAQGRVTQYGLLMDPWSWRALMPAFKATIYSPDGTRCVMDAPQNVELITFFRDLMHKYKVAPTPIEESSMAAAGGWATGPMTLFGARRGAMALGGRWWLATLRARTDLKLGAVEPPYRYARAWAGNGRIAVINQRSPRKKQALEFLVFLASREYNQLLNDQADGLAAFKKFCQGPRFETNPDYPNEDYNEVWKEVTARAVAEDTSPFVATRLANRLIDVQVDLVRANQKSPEAAMRDATAQVNAEIARSIEKDPKLKRLYEERLRNAKAAKP